MNVRDELKQLDYHVYGLAERDFDYFLDVVRRLQEAHLKRTEESIAHLRDDPDAVEIVSDVAYYAWIDTVYLWEYALWRMQGIFEGIITKDFLAGPSSERRELHGLNAKLDALQRASYSVSTSDRTALLEWARLRNALSHVPPEPYRPVKLSESDLIEYRDLVVRLCTAWREENPRRKS